MKLLRRGADHSRLADEDLMARVADGDSAAFAVVYDRHGTVAYSLAYRMCGRANVAEDVVQEAFLSAWRRASAYDSARGSLRTWLLSIVHHRSVDALRRIGGDARRRFDSPVEELEIDADVHVAEEVVERDRAGHVREAMTALPADQAKVIELAYFGG